MKKKCYFIFFLCFSSINICIEQTVKQMEDTNTILFNSFINLFSNINDTSGILYEQEIEMSDYPNYILIDTIYDSFIHRIPFFAYYATFKVSKPNGVVACVYGRYTSCYVTMSYIELIVYSLDGLIQKSVRLPFYDDANYIGNFVGFEMCDLYASSKAIVYDYKSYRTEKGKLLQRIVFDISDNGNLSCTEQGLLCHPVRP